MRSSLAFCVLAFLALALGSLAAPPQPPQVPDAIAVPAGNNLKVTYRGVGTQDYNCSADASGQLKWVLFQPEALLFNTEDKAFATPIAVHYFLPFPDPNGGTITFMHFKDQSLAVNKRSANVTAPYPDKDVDWLELETTSTTSTTCAGVFGGITWVQRINTQGGVSPNNGICSVPGRVIKVPYQADYL
jgi:hypothetical protein